MANDFDNPTETAEAADQQLTRAIQVYIPVEVFDRATAISTSSGITRANIFRLAIDRGLNVLIEQLDQLKA